MGLRNLSGFMCVEGNLEDWMDVDQGVQYAFPSLHFKMFMQKL